MSGNPTVALILFEAQKKILNVFSSVGCLSSYSVLSGAQTVLFCNANSMQTPGLIPNPTIWSRSRHRQLGWWSHLAPAPVSAFESALYSVRGHGWEAGKVMVKLLANRVIVGKRLEHALTHTNTHSPACINLLAPADRYSSINSFCQGYSERRYSMFWKSNSYREVGFQAKLQICWVRTTKRLIADVWD